jgi:hypothetical protein
MPLFAFTLFVLLLPTCAAQASFLEYTDYSTWLGAVASASNVEVAVENFANGQIDPPGLSVSTRSGMGPQIGPGNGQIVNGAWVDCVGKNACNGAAYDTTTFSSSTPLYAFGGTWVLPAAYPGGLEIYTNLFSPIISPNQYQSGPYDDGSRYTGFFGFVSNTPFSSVTLGSSYGSQSLTLSGLVLGIDRPPASAVPEPVSLLPLGLLAVWFGTMFLRLFSRAPRTSMFPDYAPLGQHDRTQR